jgi:hypothetical protein
MSDPRPCSAPEAVARALRCVASKKGQYVLGTGDYRPGSSFGQLVDEPWTDRGDGTVGSDCAGFAISWCYKLRRHRPGYNVGPWSSCSDDINCNSALEDAQHAKDCFALVDDQTPLPGDLLLYPSFTLATSDGPKQFIGHVAIVVGVSRVQAWDASSPRWDLLDVAQCHGPNGFKPGAVATDGSIWLRHDVVWPKPEHRSHLIRALP